MLAAPGAKITLKVRVLPDASVLGSELNENGLFGLFVGTVKDSSVCGLMAELLPFVNVNGICVSLVVDVLGKVRKVPLFG